MTSELQRIIPTQIRFVLFERDRSEGRKETGNYQNQNKMEDLNDKHEVYNPYTAACTNCRHKFNVITFACDAFPVEIPDIILNGEDKHNKPLKDQGNDIVFESI
jgi:hypothetical protein